MGVVLNSFARKWLLRRPWANLARFSRDHSPLWIFGWACSRAPFSSSFSCSFLVCVDNHLLSNDTPLHPKGNPRTSRIFNSCACPCIFLPENLSSLGFTYLHIVFPFPWLWFWQGGIAYGSALDLKLAHFFLAWSLRGIGLKKFSLWQDCSPLLTYILVRERMLQIQIRCRMATQT